MATIHIGIAKGSLVGQQAIATLYNLANEEKKQSHWQEQLANTPIEIIYRPRKRAVIPDALSRIPCTAATPETSSTTLLGHADSNM